MTPKVLRAPLAEQDLDEIWDFVANDSIVAADRLIDMIVGKCHLLAGNPEMGQARPELAPTLRSFSLGSYMIFFRPIEDGIELARVIHGARDADALF